MGQQVELKITADSQSVVSSAQAISDAFAKVTEKMKEAQKAGDIDFTTKYLKQAEQLIEKQKKLQKNPDDDDDDDNDDKPPSDKEHKKSASNAIAMINKIGSGINSGINKLGNTGDLQGTILDGAQAGANILSNLGGDLEKAGLGLNIALTPFRIMNTLQGFYNAQMKGAMRFNAMINNTERVENEKIKETDEERKAINTENINNAFEAVANSATKFGHSMEEGMALVTNLTQHGIKNIYKMEEAIFAWSDATGVDTGLVSNFYGRTKRFKPNDFVKINGVDHELDPLATAFKVNSETGMKRGQFAETLEALQSVFEDGISKGFSKSVGDIGATMAYLYKRASAGKGGNKNKFGRFWQGTEGANRLMQMNNAVANATGLNSVSDILTYRAAQNIIDTKRKAVYENTGLPSNDGKSKYGYIDNQLLLEQGLTPELLDSVKEQVEKAYGKNNVTGQIEAYKRIYGLNYTGATQVYELMQNKGNLTKKELNKKIEAINSNPQYLSDQKANLKTQEDIRKTVVDIGKSVSGIQTVFNTFVDKMKGWLKTPVTQMDEKTDLTKVSDEVLDTNFTNIDLKIKIMQNRDADSNPTELEKLINTREKLKNEIERRKKGGGATTATGKVTETDDEWVSGIRKAVEEGVKKGLKDIVIQANIVPR